jgi:hypothetical protein
MKRVKKRENGMNNKKIKKKKVFFFSIPDSCNKTKNNFKNSLFYYNTRQDK